MSVTLGIVEVSFASAQPNSDSPAGAAFASRRFGGKPLLEWVVRRVTDSLLLDQVTVVVEAHHEDLVRRLTPSDVAVFAGRQFDALSRFAAAARTFNASEVVRVAIDSPFVDPELIDRLVCTGNSDPGCDYIGYYSDDGRSAAHNRLGVCAEWCRATAIHRADQQASDTSERQDVTRFLYTHPDLFQLRLIPVPRQLDRSDVRLAVDREEDWDHAQIIFDALGPENLDWQRIADLLNQQPFLRQRMAVLNRADQDQAESGIEVGPQGHAVRDGKSRSVPDLTNRS